MNWMDNPGHQRRWTVWTIEWRPGSNGVKYAEIVPHHFPDEAEARATAQDLAAMGIEIIGLYPESPEDYYWSGETGWQHLPPLPKRRQI